MSCTMSISSCSDEEREECMSSQLKLLSASPPGSQPGSRPTSRPSSRPSSPQTMSRRNRRLPSPDAVGEALQDTVENLLQKDLLDTGTVVELANSREAHQKMEDLLPIYFYSWKLRNVEAALIYTLLHIFVLLGQYTEIETERSTNEEYISKLKDNIARLEDEIDQLKRNRQEEEESNSSPLTPELLRLRKENTELRREQAKLRASQNELFQINDAWSRDYHSLTQKIDALTSGTWPNGTSPATNGTTLHQKHTSTTPTHPPSLTNSSASSSPSHTHQHHDEQHMCTSDCTLQEKVTELKRQVKELDRSNKDLEKLLVEEERKSKKKDMMIKTFDCENQALQLQIQEIGDLQAAVRMKADFRKMELQMKHKERQYQDATSKRIQLQQQVDKLKHAFMSILGVGTSSSRRHGSSAHYHDCRVHQYMSEPLPPPPTPPGLIARGNHFGSLVEKDRQHAMLFDEQVTGFERSTPNNLSLPSDTRSWPQVTKRVPSRPNTLVPKTNGLSTNPQSTKTACRFIACPMCKKGFDIDGETGFTNMFDHISYCDTKR